MLVGLRTQERAFMMQDWLVFVKLVGAGKCLYIHCVLNFFKECLDLKNKRKNPHRQGWQPGGCGGGVAGVEERAGVMGAGVKKLWGHFKDSGVD